VKGRSSIRAMLIVAGSFLSVPVVYVPFRLLAQRYNIIGAGFSDDFRYWWCALLWPSFSFLAGLTPLFASTLRLRWCFLLGVLVLSLVLWEKAPLLDGLLGIPGGGLVGFNSYWSNQPGFSTSQLSMVLSPIAFFLGAAGGVILGAFTGRSSKKDWTN